MTAVIAGCGDLGSFAGGILAAEGHRVVGLRRMISQLPPEIEGQAVDLTRQQPVLPRDTSIVIVALTADSRTESSYRTTYVTGLTQVLEAVERQLTVQPRIVVVSSTAVYGTDDGSWVDEDTATSPSAPTARVLLDAERELHDRFPAGIVLRLAGIYGPGRDRLLDVVRAGNATLPSSPTFTNRIHRDDAARAIVHLATKRESPEPIYIGADHAPADRGDVLRFLADELGVAEPRTPDESSAGARGKRCTSARLRATGFTFQYRTYREGYHALLSNQ